jgi:hypothetical protein
MVAPTRHHQPRVSLLKNKKKAGREKIRLIINGSAGCQNFLFLECTGCSKEIVEGQALIALDSQWHVWCFKCVTCNTLLHGEYMGKYVWWPFIIITTATFSGPLID